MKKWKIEIYILQNEYPIQISFDSKEDAQDVYDQIANISERKVSLYPKSGAKVCINCKYVTYMRLYQCAKTPLEKPGSFTTKG